MKREILSNDPLPPTSRRRIVQLSTRGMGWFAQLAIAVLVLGWSVAMVLAVVLESASVLAFGSIVRLAVAAVLVTAVSVTVLPELVRSWMRWSHRRRSSGGTWRNDHRWRPGPQRRSPIVRALRPLQHGAGIVPMLFMFLPGSKLWTVPIVSPILGVCVAAGVGWFAYRTHALLWSGTLRVQYDPVPVAPGEQVVVTFGTSRGATPLEHLVLRLRCLTDAKNAMGFGSTETRLQWQETVTIDDPDALPAPGSDIEIAFDLPADRPSTHLATKYPVCWELAIEGRTGDARYEEVFLVPVYARDRAG